MKDRKTRKSRSEKNVVGFSSAVIFSAWKRKAVTQGRTRALDHTTRKRTREPIPPKIKCWGIRGPALVSFSFYVNVSGMRPAFEYTSSLGSPLRQVVHGSMVRPWVAASRFLAGNREAELKPATFSSLLLFIAFLSFLFS